MDNQKKAAAKDSSDTNSTSQIIDNLVNNECDSIDPEAKQYIKGAFLSIAKTIGTMELKSAQAQFYVKGVFQFSRYKGTDAEQKALKLVDVLLRELGNEKDKNPFIDPSKFFGNANISEEAFEDDYVDNGGMESFWKHLKNQKANFDSSESGKFPFFPIVQSSGYGKSRLLWELSKSTNSTHGDPEWPTIIYFSFAVSGAYPKANVTIVTSLKDQNRTVVENAFVQLFTKALEKPSARFYTLGNEDDQKALPTKKNSTTNAALTSRDQVLFVMDEVSQLTHFRAANDVDFFRCFCCSSVAFVSMNRNCFFVTLSTSTALSKSAPSIRLDASHKDFPNADNRESMKEFLFHRALGLRNDTDEILQWTVSHSHEPNQLLSMGRPLWRAYLRKGSMPTDLVVFAQGKLLLETPSPQVAKLRAEQVLALLGCRVCLTISSLSRLSSTLVGSHMATAVKISDDREEVVVTYPSEPALALAARLYMNEKSDFVYGALTQLKQYFTSGAVLKGHRGELIVRVLNILAMDRCMHDVGCSLDSVKEVPLYSFLDMFSREGASLTLDSSKSIDSVLSDKQIAMLKREGIYDEALAEHGSSRKRAKTCPGDDGRWNGFVCFTHFTYLSKAAQSKPLITPNLLRYAYRRTAAIVMDDGRRGIDWIIPVRLNDKTDEFIGLCGQDKNQMRDTLGSLTESNNVTTHHKMSAEYFLTKEEKELFEKEGWSLNWPAILFSIGVDDKCCALAKDATRRRLHSDGGVVETDFPCIVLSGLGYGKLMSKEADSKLRELRDAVIDVPDEYMEMCPLTYGVASGS